MKICPYCAEENGSKVKYCEHCGRKLSEKLEFWMCVLCFFIPIFAYISALGYRKNQEIRKSVQAIMWTWLGHLMFAVFALFMELGL